MEIVLLCAGRGSRLGRVTEKSQKAMTEVHGIPIIENTINILKNLKINNIKIILGYQYNNFSEFEGVKKIVNKNWSTTNMVGSYFMSINKDSFNDTLFIYGDIIVNKNVIDNYINALDKNFGSILVDNNWFDYWSMRLVNPLDDAETCVVDKDDCLIELGKKINEDDIPNYQYTGIGYFPASYQKKIYDDWTSELSLTNKGRNFT